MEIELFEDLKTFNIALGHFYEKTKSVKKAAYQASYQLSPDMSFEATRIYRLLISDNPKEDLSTYEMKVSSRHLRKIAKLVVNVHEEGDVITEKGSTFLQGLIIVEKEINAEIRYGSLLPFRHWGRNINSFRIREI